MSCRFLVFVIVSALLGALPAMSQENANFPIERFRPAVDREGLLDVESAVVTEPFNYDVALWLGYAYKPLVLFEITDGDRTEAGTLISHRIGANLVAAFTVHDRVELGLDLPLVLHQVRGDLDSSSLSVGGLDTIGVGDLRFVPKFQLLQAEDHVIDLALLASIRFPTHSASDAYFGEESVSVIPEVAISGRIDAIRLAANLGYRWRDETQFLDLTVGPELLYRAGVGYDFGFEGDLPLELALTINGATGTEDFFSESNENPVELLFGATLVPVEPVNITLGTGTGLVSGYGSPVARVFLGISYSPRVYDRDGDGISDDEDACPDDPEDEDLFEDADGCPDLDNDQDGLPDTVDQCPLDPEDHDGFEDEDGCSDPDNDQDGVLDVDDGCPDDAEDVDLFQDEDGCPEPDNDLDGLLDVEDECPNDPEDIDMFEDDNGCPDLDNDQDDILDRYDSCPNDPEDYDGEADEDGCPEEFTEVVGDQIEIWEKVHFETDSAVIRPDSFALLDEVARIIIANPTMHVRIEGHTDSRGGDQHNLELSQARSESVREYLIINTGIQGDRLDPIGVGEANPIETNDTRAGRAANRRVEFHITSR